MALPYICRSSHRSGNAAWSGVPRDLVDLELKVAAEGVITSLSSPERVLLPRCSGVWTCMLNQVWCRRCARAKPGPLGSESPPTLSCRTVHLVAETAFAGAGHSGGLGGVIKRCIGGGCGESPWTAQKQTELHQTRIRKELFCGQPWIRSSGWQVRDMTGDGGVIKRRVRDGRGEFPVDCPIDDSAVRVHYRCAAIPKPHQSPGVRAERTHYSGARSWTRTRAEATHVLVCGLVWIAQGSNTRAKVTVQICQALV